MAYAPSYSYAAPARYGASYGVVQGFYAATYRPTPRAIAHGCVNGRCVVPLRRGLFRPGAHHR